MSMINQSKPILVFLAGGIQGGAVVRAALARGLKVRALVRDRTRAALSVMPCVEVVEGDLSDPVSLRAASIGVDHAVLQVPVGPIETMQVQAQNALAAFCVAGVRSFILKLPSASRPVPCAEPSFVANRMVQDVARASGIPFAVIRPTMYLDNLLKPSVRMEIMDRGVFAPPILASQCIAWTSADDCAEAALMLLERGALGSDHLIAGPESVTGDELAARVSIGLGRTIRYCSQSIDEFEREVSTTMSGVAGQRVVSKFRYFAEYPEEANAILGPSFISQTGLEGFIPTDIADWVRSHRITFGEMRSSVN